MDAPGRGAPARSADPAPTVQVISTIPSGVRVHYQSFSADYRHAAYLTDAKDGKRTAVVDGKPGPSYDHVSQVLFTPDGAHWAYLGIRGKTQRLVLDGHEQPEFGYVLTDFVLSRDGRHTAYAASRGAARFVVRDGKPGPLFDEIRSSDKHITLSKSPAGDRVAYPARKSKAWFWVVDGSAGEAYDEVSQELAFSPNGLHFAYLGKRGAKRWMIEDGRAREIGGACERADFPAISNDGRHAAYVCRRAKRAIVVADGIEKEPKENVGGLQFVPADNRLVYPIYDAGAGRVMDGDHEGPPFTQVSWPQVAPDGVSVFYVGFGARHDYAVLNGRIGEAFDPRSVGAADFTPDGRRLVLIGRRAGRLVMAVDGRDIPLANDPEGSWLDHLDLDTAGAEARYGSRRGQDLVRVTVPLRAL